MGRKIRTVNPGDVYSVRGKKQVQHWPVPSSSSSSGELTESYLAVHCFQFD